MTVPFLKLYFMSITGKFLYQVVDFFILMGFNYVLIILIIFYSCCLHCAFKYYTTDCLIDYCINEITDCFLSHEIIQN